MINSNIFLRPIELSDTSKIVFWRNKKSVRKNLLLTEEQHIEYFDRYILTGKIKQFVIVAEENGKRIDIGCTFIKNIDLHSRKAEFGIFIGEEASRGKGYGAIATELTVKYAFDVLKLNKVYLTVFSNNIPAVNAYIKCGFRIEGELKEDFLSEDGYVNVIVMAVFRDLWNKDKQYYGTD